LNDRFDRTRRYLEHWGAVVAIDTGAGRGRRLLEFHLDTPGDELPPLTRALFREYYDRDRFGDWELVKYTYEYLDVVRSLRLAYHFHSIGASGAIAHAHCEQGFALATVEPTMHFRAVDYDLHEANAEFMRLYGSDRPPDCDSFLPLRVERL
jgi:hypothetical protein